MEKIHVKLNLPMIEDITSLSWGEIINKANSHRISEKCIGQEKQITIGDETYDVVLIGVNHDDLVSGRKANTTWQLKNCYNTNYRMNPSKTKDGGYGSSQMHTTHLPSIFNQIQSDVRDAIKPVIKKSSDGISYSSTIVNVNCNLFLLSEIEIFGETRPSAAGEGTQYVYWQQHNNADDRRKGLQSNPISYTHWWERSPSNGVSGSFNLIGEDGNVYFMQANAPKGVSFAFCI